VVARVGRMNPDSELAAKPPYKPPGIFWLDGEARFCASAAYVAFPVALPRMPFAAPPGTTRVLNAVAKPSVKIRLAVRALVCLMHCWKAVFKGLTEAVMAGPTTPMLIAVPPTGRTWFGLVEMMACKVPLKLPPGTGTRTLVTRKVRVTPLVAGGRTGTL